MLTFVLYSLLCNVSCIIFSSVSLSFLIIGYVCTLFVS
jgi:hypothetical protein